MIAAPAVSYTVLLLLLLQQGWCGLCASWRFCKHSGDVYQFAILLIGCHHPATVDWLLCSAYQSSSTATQLLLQQPVLAA